MTSWLAWLRQDSRKPPFLLKYRSSQLYIVSAVVIAIFTDLFLYGLIVPVTPFALTDRSRVASDRVQYWNTILLAIYGGSLLAASPVCGWFADRSPSRRLPLLLGLLALGGATVLLCVGSNLATLVAGRLFQGIAGAVVAATAIGLLVDTVGERDIGQNLGYVQIAISMGPMLGPLLGGVVFESSGYYSVFGLAFGLVGLDIFLRLTLIEKKIASKWTGSQDALGNGTSDVTEKSEHRDVQIQRESPPGSSPQTDANRSPQSPDPPSTGLKRFASHLPPVITLLGSARLLSALWGCFVQAALITGFDGVLPLFVHDTFGWGSTGAGLIFLPIALPSLLSPLVGMVSDRHGPRWLATSGFLLAAPILVLLRLVTHNSIGQKILLCALLGIIGFAFALMLTPLSAEITYLLVAKEREHPGLFGPKGAYAQAYALYIVAFAAGILVGPIWAGMVRDAAGWGTMGWSLAIFSLAGAVPTTIWAGGLITTQWGRKWTEVRGGVDRRSEEGESV